MTMKGVFTVLAIFLCVHADAFELGQYPSDTRLTSGVCSQLAQSANATSAQILNTFNGLGDWSVSVDTNHTFNGGDGNTVLTENSPGAVANVWLDSYTDIHLDYGGNYYSACAYIFKGLPSNTIRRGQQDDGSCTQTLSKKCVLKLTNLAALNAGWLIGDPGGGPYSNLTPPVLATICDKISNGFGTINQGPQKRDTQTLNTFPRECDAFFKNGYQFYPSIDKLVLTGNKTAARNCTLQDSSRDPQIQGTYGYYWNSNPPGLCYKSNGSTPIPSDSYDELVQQVWPIMTVIMPPANNSGGNGHIQNPMAYMTCLRANVIQHNSRAPVALPKPTIVPFPGRKLSRGPTAGIAVGCTFGLGLTAAVTWHFWKRKKLRMVTQNGSSDLLPGKRSETPILSEMAGDEIYQLESRQGGRAELELTSPRSELPGDLATPAELAENPAAA